MPVLPFLPAIIGAAGGIGGAAIASSAAGSAADTGANAANYAANLQAEAGENALNFQKGVFGTEQANLAPFLAAGQGAAVNLASLLGVLPPGARTTTPAQYMPAQVPAGIRIGPNGSLQTLLPGGAGAPAAWMTLPSSQYATYGLEAGPGGKPVPAGTSKGVPLSSMVNPALGESGSLMAPWTEKFVAPTDVTEQNDPGFQFRLQQGQQALERSAAARGGLLSGGTGKALTRYGQEYASNEYQNVYNRALEEYQQRYNIFQQNQANQFNRLAAMSGMGQTAAGQLGAAGQNASNTTANILLGTARGMSDAANLAGAARATGYANQGSIWGNTLANLGNYVTLASLLKNPQSTYGWEDLMNADAVGG